MMHSVLCFILGLLDRGGNGDLPLHVPNKYNIFRNAEWNTHSNVPRHELGIFIVYI